MPRAQLSLKADDSLPFVPLNGRRLKESVGQSKKGSMTDRAVELLIASPAAFVVPAFDEIGRLWANLSYRAPMSMNGRISITQLSYSIEACVE